MIEAVHRAQAAAALKGNAYAQKQFIETCQRAERAQRLEVQQLNTWWADYVRSQREIHSHAVRNGLPTPTTLPHPDDVVIDSETGVRFIGPFDEASAERLRTTVLMRDTLIVQDAFQNREIDGPTREDSTALACAMLLDESLPKRYRLAELDWTMRMLRLRGVTKRELRRRLRRDWAKLGVDWQPDRHLPKVSEFAAMLEQLMDAVQTG